MDQSISWITVGSVEDIPRQGSRVVRTDFGDIALFRDRKSVV